MSNPNKPLGEADDQASGDAGLEPEFWQPVHGVKTKVTAWFIIIAFLACVVGTIAAMLVVWMG